MTVNVNVTPVKGLSVGAASNLQMGLVGRDLATGISPNSVSPVLKQNLIIQLASNFPDILDIDAYSVFVMGTDYKRMINIVSVDNIAKTMTVKFNGAPSGSYRVVIEGPDGFIGGPPLTLTTVIGVDDFTPKQGSTLGGTLVTITGGHYGNVATDNPVKIGDNYCLVESTSDSEIKCRIAIDSNTVASSAEVIVFAKTSEEMECNVAGAAGCFFDYVDGTTTISGMTEMLDTATNSIQLTVAGTGFTLGDVANTELWIDGKKQSTVDVQATTATFSLIDAMDTSSSDIKVYFAEGSPSGSIAQQMFTPALISISPAVGSSGGSRLTVTGVGFGPNTENLNLYHVESSQEICFDVEVTGYGTFIC